MPADSEGSKIVTAIFRGAFPDPYFTVEDKGATRKTFHDTHEGDSPKGLTVTMGLIDIVLGWLGSSRFASSSCVHLKSVNPTPSAAAAASVTIS
jgi:hypothetical protein